MNEFSFSPLIPVAGIANPIKHVGQLIICSEQDWLFCWPVSFTGIFKWFTIIGFPEKGSVNGFVICARVEGDDCNVVGRITFVAASSVTNGFGGKGSGAERVPVSDEED